MSKNIRIESALTEKGVVKTAVRKGVVEKLSPDLASFGEQVPDKASWYQVLTDNKGNTIYAVIDLRVTTNNPTIVKPRTPSKAEPAVAEPIVID